MIGKARNKKNDYQNKNKKKIFRREEPGRSDHKKKKKIMKTSKTERAMFAVLIPIAIYFVAMAIIAIVQFIQAL